MSNFDIAKSPITDHYYFVLGKDKYDITDFAEKKYQQGRADVIDKVIEYLKCEFIKQNNPHSELVPTIVINMGFIETLEQLKEQK